VSHRKVGAGVIALVLVVLVWNSGAGIAGADACANTTTVPIDRATEAASNAAVLCLINTIRADRGLQRLKIDRRLRRAARFHSRDMVGRKYFGHHGPAGDDLASRLQHVGYFDKHPGGSASEALAWGTDASADILVDALMGSPEHRSMIVNPTARAIGMGLSIGAPETDVYGPAMTLVLDFGEQ
jgi:uncharacterized protein YkwD